MERQPCALKDFAQELVGINGLLGQAIVSLVILCVARLVRAWCPLQEVLIGNAGHWQQQGQNVEGLQTLGLQHLNHGVSRESWRNSTLHSEEEADHQSKQHGQASLLVPPQHLLPGLSFCV
eukprot:Skav227932  [mRNA]  locus=scaffold146:396533:396895:- [translate_table: standard]